MLGGRCRRILQSREAILRGRSLVVREIEDRRYTIVGDGGRRSFRGVTDPSSLLSSDKRLTLGPSIHTRK